jgi:hypothetical protein
MISVLFRNIFSLVAVLDIRLKCAAQDTYQQDAFCVGTQECNPDREIYEAQLESLLQVEANHPSALSHQSTMGTLLYEFFSGTLQLLAVSISCQPHI